MQLFFTRITDFAHVHERTIATVADVEIVYRQQMLGPEGHSGLLHYETRLRQALDDDIDHAIAMSTLAEAAKLQKLDRDAFAQMTERFSKLAPNASDRANVIVRILEHDGYLQYDSVQGAHYFPSRWLRYYWDIRYRRTGHPKP